MSASATPDRYDVERSCAGKARYLTEAFAAEVAARVWRDRGTALRAYVCAICGGVHLTKRGAVLPPMRSGFRPAAPPRRERDQGRGRRRARRRR